MGRMSFIIVLAFPGTLKVYEVEYLHILVFRISRKLGILTPQSLLTEEQSGFLTLYSYLPEIQIQNTLPATRKSETKGEFVSQS